MPVSTTIRAANAGEREIIGRRMNRRREGVSATGGSWRREGVALSVIGAAAVVASAILFFRTRSGAFVLGGALGLTFFVFGLMGSRRARTSTGDRLSKIGRDQEEAGLAITEYRITTDRIVVAAGEDGDVWWLFRTDPGTWLVFEQGQWGELDGSGRQWHRETRVAVDAHHAVVSIDGSGDPIVVERRELRPPDFTPTPETLFWSPPEAIGPLPAQITGDPTAPTAI